MAPRSVLIEKTSRFEDLARPVSSQDALRESGDSSGDNTSPQYQQTQHKKKLNMEAKNCHERILSRIFHVSLTTGIVLILVLKDTGNLDYLFLLGRFDPPL